MKKQIASLSLASKTKHIVVSVAVYCRIASMREAKAAVTATIDARFSI